MAVRASPVLKRRRLATELQTLRSKCGMTADEAAKQIGISKSTLSRIENGLVTATPPVAAALLRLYGVEEAEIQPLLQLARDARKRGWWMPWKDVTPPWAMRYIALESEAVKMQEFQPVLIPGLLQTEGYADAIFRATRPDASDRYVKRQIELRMLRQQRNDDFKLSVIIGEGALRIPVGGSNVMRPQLQRIVKAADEGRYDVQVLTAAAREHGSMGSGFITLRFADPVDTPMVYLETHAGSLYVEDEQEVQYYASLFKQLSTMALSVPDSVRLISEIAETI